MTPIPLVVKRHAELGRVRAITGVREAIDVLDTGIAHFPPEKRQVVAEVIRALEIAEQRLDALEDK